ncbi:MAG: hypothetical protein ACRCU2_28290, partial [Planktothrix sp.]
PSAIIEKGGEQFSLTGNGFKLTKEALKIRADGEEQGGEGFPPEIFLFPVYRATIPWKLMNRTLTYTLVRQTSTDEKYHTNRWVVTSEEGEDFVVWENPDLLEIFEEEGLGAKFKIAKIRVVETSNKQNKKIKNHYASLVSVADEIVID